MSAVRKSTRTPVVSEKLKSLVTTRAPSARGKKQGVSSLLNADARDGETADNDESSTFDGEDRTDSQDENRPGSGVLDDDATAGDGNDATAGNGLAADDAGSAAGNVGDGSAKRRKKTKKQKR